MIRPRLPFAALAAAIVCAAASGASTHVARAQEPAPGGALLRLDAVAVDRAGVPVTDLSPADLEVWIGIYRVPIESLTAVRSTDERGGRLVVLLLDDVSLDPSVTPRVREAARRFVTRMAPGDQMAIVGLAGDVMKTTDDPAQLLRSVASYNVRPVGFVRLEQFGEHVLNTLAQVSRQLSEVPGRKIVVGIGAAWLFDTPILPASVGRDLRTEWVAAMRAMAGAHASLYVIDPGGLGAAPFAFSGANGFAGETGGHAFVNTNDINGAADRIMREAEHYYVIGVRDPPIGRGAELRPLDIKVRRRGVTVRARKWIAGGREVRP